MDSQASSLIRKAVVAGCILSATIIVSIFAWRSRKTNPPPLSKPPSVRSNNLSSRKSINDQSMSLVETEKSLYKEPITDETQFSIQHSRARELRVSNLKYKLIMNLNKGLTYEGSVKLQFDLKDTPNADVQLDFNGDELFCVQVNDVMVPEAEVRYHQHKISLSRELFGEGTNAVEVIFSNKYSFFDDGMSTYFKIEQNNKYSLREQCIYTNGSPFNIVKIIPTLNAIITDNKQVDVDLQVIHPENFLSVSNVEKKMIKICGASDFSEYRFFLDEHHMSASALNSSFNSSRHSVRTVKSKIKFFTKFKDFKLDNISELFLSCLPVTQVKVKHNLCVSLRFYSRKSEINKASNFAHQLIQQLIELEPSLQKLQLYNRKIDILFIGSKKMHGYFSKGVIVLKEDVLRRQDRKLHPKTVYLVVRALISMSKIKHNRIEMRSLNQQALSVYPRANPYMALLQIKYAQVSKAPVSTDYAPFYMELFCKQIKYIQEVKGIDSYIKPWIVKLQQPSSRTQSDEGFWAYFIDNIEFVDSDLRNLLTDLSLRLKSWKGLSPILLEGLKRVLRPTRYYLDVLSDEEMEKDITYLIEKCPKSLKRRLPHYEAGDKFGEMVSEELYRYVRIPQNIEQCNVLYEQFINFDEKKNFHHVEVITNEMKRIKNFTTPRPITVKEEWTLNVSKTMRLMDITNEIDPVINKLISLSS